MDHAANARLGTVTGGSGTGDLLAELGNMGVQTSTDTRGRLTLTFPVSTLTADFSSWLQDHRSALQAAHGERVSWHPLSSNERAFYLRHRHNPVDGSDNVGIAILIQSPVDRRALREALQTTQDRHPMLRAIYRWSGEQPERQVRAQAVSVVEIDATDLDDESLAGAVRARHLQPFDLATGPVFHACLFTQSDSRHLLLCVASHVVVDGVSMSTILNDVRIAYEAALTGSEAALPGLRHTYDDFVESQRSVAGRAAREQDWNWWRQVLRNVPQHSGLFDPAAHNDAGGGHSRRLNLAAQSAAVHEAAGNHGTTPFVVLLAAWVLCLTRILGTHQLVVGIPVAGRAGSRFRGVVGTFMSVLPLPVELDPALDTAGLIPDVHRLLRQIRAHDSCAYGELVERLAALHQARPVEFVHVGFTLQRARAGLLGLSHALESGAVNFGGLLVSPCELPNQEAAFDIALELYEFGRSFRGYIKARKNRVSAETLKLTGEYFQCVVTELAADPAGASRALPPAGLVLTTQPDRPVTEPGTSPERFNSPAERFVAAVWADLLDSPPTDTHQSFFEAGGHSLLAAQLLTRVRGRYQVDVPLRAFFDDPTVSGLVAQLAGRRPGPDGTPP